MPSGQAALARGCRQSRRTGSRSRFCPARRAPRRRVLVRRLSALAGMGWVKSLGVPHSRAAGPARGVVVVDHLGVALHVAVLEAELPHQMDGVVLVHQQLGVDAAVAVAVGHQHRTAPGLAAPAGAHQHVVLAAGVGHGLKAGGVGGPRGDPDTSPRPPGGTGGLTAVRAPSRTVRSAERTE